MGNSTTKALIYCRVSSDKQVEEGHGLQAQKKRCEDYAKNRGYFVDRAFFEKGVSGTIANRSAIGEMLAYISDNAHHNFVVIIDDISRLARNVTVHRSLRASLALLGTAIESPNFKFDDSPEGEFIETILAAQAELDGKQNRVRVIQRMRARMESGYWPFRAFPTGYKRAVTKEHGKFAVPDGDVAKAITVLFTAVSNRIILTQEDARLFLENEYKKTNLAKRVSSSGVKRILSNKFYIGIIDYERWEIFNIIGKHEPITTPEAFNAAQELLSARSHPRKKSDYSADFPLRGFVLCFLCKEQLTASWNTGRSKSYANYRCKNRYCPMRNVSLAKEVVEPNFEQLLRRLKPKNQVISLAVAVLNDIWQTMDLERKQELAMTQKEINRLEENITAILDKSIKAINPAIVAEYEKRIGQLANQKSVAESKRASLSSPSTDDMFGTALNLVTDYIAEPVKMWHSDSYNDKKTLLEMYFSDGPVYDPEYGFGTANLTCLPKLLQVKAGDKKSLVDLREIESRSENLRTKSSTSIGCLSLNSLAGRQSEH